MTAAERAAQVVDRFFTGVGVRLAAGAPLQESALPVLRAFQARLPTERRWFFLNESALASAFTGEADGSSRVCAQAGFAGAGVASFCTSAFGRPIDDVGRTTKTRIGS